MPPEGMAGRHAIARIRELDAHRERFLRIVIGELLAAEGEVCSSDIVDSWAARSTASASVPAIADRRSAFTMVIALLRRMRRVGELVEAGRRCVASGLPRLYLRRPG